MLLWGAGRCAVCNAYLAFVGLHLHHQCVQTRRTHAAPPRAAGSIQTFHCPCLCPVVSTRSAPACTHLHAHAVHACRGPAWKASRRAFETSVLRPDRLAAHMPAVRRCTERFLARLAPYADGSTAVDMKDEYGVIALAITGEVAYGWVLRRMCAVVMISARGPARPHNATAVHMDVGLRAAAPASGWCQAVGTNKQHLPLVPHVPLPQRELLAQ